MLDKAELARLSRSERAQLARALAELDGPARQVQSPSTWRRRLFIAAALLCTLILAAWIVILAVTLPRHYRAGGWSAAWVGFDGALLVCFAATAWAAWRRRQVLILCLVVLAALLVCDAWFDTTLDYATRGFPLSLLMALVVELPLAVVALIVARRLLRLTLGRIERLEGNHGPVPAFWKVPLFTEDTAGSGYRDLFRPPEELAADPEPGGQPSPGHEAWRPRGAGALADRENGSRPDEPARAQGRAASSAASAVGRSAYRNR